MLPPIGVDTLPLVGIAIIGVLFVMASLQSRNRLPFIISEGAYISISTAAALLVAQFLVDSTSKTIIIFAVGSLAWGVGYETGQIDRKR